MSLNKRLIGLGGSAGPQVGEAYGGGIIFYLDGAGGGMVTASEPRPADSNLGRWTIFSDVPGADGVAIGTGYQNNLDIRAAGTCNAVNYVFDATINGQSDWFLPSQGELQEVHNTVRQLMTYPTDNLYWSSTEYSASPASYAMALRPWNGSFQYYSKGSALYCLPVRQVANFNDPYIGQFTEGGIVFYINSGSREAYVVSLDTWQVRYGTTQPIYNALRFNQAQYIGAGPANTALMLSTFGASNNTHIAYYTQTYSGGGFTDWFIPSNNTLRQYSANRGFIDSQIIANGGTTRNTGGFLASNLSSEYNVDSVSFVTGNDYTVAITANTFNTKFVRKFSY